MPHSAAEKTWENCLTQISDQISTQSFKTWFAPITPLSLEHDDEAARLRLAVPDAFHTEWLESHYAHVIRKAARDVLGQHTDIAYEVSPTRPEAAEPNESQWTDVASAAAIRIAPEEQAARERKPNGEDLSGGRRPNGEDVAGRRDRSRMGVDAPYGTSHDGPPWKSHPRADSKGRAQAGGGRNAQVGSSGDGHGGAAGNGHATWTPTPRAVPAPHRAARSAAPVGETRLKPEYNFESFIEGDCNRLARSAAVAISHNPGGTSFNPFMVYGGVGLGKTHIVQAIGNHVLSAGLAARVLYISSEQFTSQFVRSIQENRASDFSNFYRQIDLLIVDDVQFFGGKEKTQEEFFHIFNELHQTGKQIILCADRPPSEISGIEERLLSRFRWGLSADIQPPDLETRIAILQHKAAQHGVSLHPDIVEFVAERIRANIRQLEGALLKLAAHIELYDRTIDLESAKEILRDMIDDCQVRLEIEDIQRTVAQYFDQPQEALSAKTRKREVVTARHVAMYFCKRLTTHSLKSIGLRFGGRDHSTVIHACNTVENRIEVEPGFSGEIDEIEQKLQRQSPALSSRRSAQMGVA